MSFEPFRIEGADRPARWLITCDHASNSVPPLINGGNLGVHPSDMERHIAYDIGADGLASALAEHLEAPAIFANFSRLVIDPNRGEDDPTLVMQLYDGTIIPGNRHADAAERNRRLEMCYRPYHAALAALAARQADTVIVSVHSFTPQFRGRAPRPWHVGILYASDERLTRPLITRLNREGDLCIGENEPYSGALTGDAIDQHAISQGRANVLVELRNDLISNASDQRAWAARLAPILEAAARDAGV